jgi:type IV fimbrial biogenesis protein FimT
MENRGRASGFTLLELIIVMTIAGVLLAIAVPSYRYVSTSNRMSGEVNSLLGDMQYARAEAIKEGQTVSVCVSNDGASCDGGVSPPWSEGWIVFSDVNGNGAVDTGGTNPDVVLKIRTSLANGGSTDTFTSTVSGVTFNREGFASGLTASPTTFTLHNTPTVAAFTRCLQLNPTGYLTTVGNTAAGCT